MGKETKNMKIFGKTISEYIGFERGFLILVLVVGLTRLVLSLLGVANSVDKFLSITVLMLLGLLYYSVRVYTSGFGSYKQLLPVFVLQWLLAQSIVIAGIVIAISTSKDNIFSAPEYSPNKADGRTWAHAGSHMVVIVIGPLICWLLGSLIMFITKRIAPGGAQRAGTAQA
jgi:hypothetical protein